MSAEDVTPLSDHATLGRSDKRLRIGGGNGLRWYVVGVFFFGMLTGVGLMVGGALERNGTGPLVTGIVIVVGFLPFLPFMVWAPVRPLVVTGGTLRIPRVFSSVRIPLASVSGVGLVYQFSPHVGLAGGARPVGWQLRVWSDDKVLVLARWTVVTWAQQRMRGRSGRVVRRIENRDWTVPLPDEDAGYLARTKPGRAARLIYEATAEWQGQTGPLVSRAMEKRVVYEPAADFRVAAWWSPDGTMGRAAGLPGMDPLLAPHDGSAHTCVISPRFRAGLFLLLGVPVSFLAFDLFDAIDGAWKASPRNGLQEAIVILGPVLGLGVFALFLLRTIRLWKRNGADRRTRGQPLN
ncbi:MAG TPA: hypothetical protein VGS21_07845 [Acidimicrobiales bacterium]|nr:hypothetical protein [Acidimicrobiales bacterium]